MATVAFHGRPRYTKDLDVWLSGSNEEAEKVVHALDAFGFGSLGLTAEDFSTPDQVIQLGYPPNRIDMLTGMAAVDFEECWKDRIEVDVDGARVAFIDLEGLIRLKKAAGRKQDLADIEFLQRRRR